MTQFQNVGNLDSKSFMKPPVVAVILAAHFSFVHSQYSHLFLPPWSPRQLTALLSRLTFVLLDVLKRDKPKGQGYECTWVVVKNVVHDSGLPPPLLAGYSSLFSKLTYSLHMRVPC